MTRSSLRVIHPDTFLFVDSRQPITTIKTSKKMIMQIFGIVIFFYAINYLEI